MTRVAIGVILVLALVLVGCGSGNGVTTYSDCNDRISDMEAAFGPADEAISCANSEQEDWWSATYWYWCQGVSYTFTQDGRSCSESVELFDPVCGLDHPGFLFLEHQSNPFTGQGSYSIALHEGTLYVVLRLKLTGEPVSDELRERYEEGIERIWSTTRFEVPIVIDVVWTDKDPDKIIKVVSGVGRWHISQWRTKGQIEEIAAHEAGHYFGLFDEYGGGDAQGFDGGAAPGPRPWHQRGLMSNHNSPVLDYYYDGFLAWYEEKVGESEPARIR